MNLNQIHDDLVFGSMLTTDRPYYYEPPLKPNV